MRSHINENRIQISVNSALDQVQLKKMENLAQQVNGDLNPSLKLAIAMAIVESRRLQKLHPSATTDAACNGDSHPQAVSGNNSESDAIKWKRKAKQLKEEIIRLKEDLRIAEDGLHHDAFPQSIPCKCYFFDNLGQLSPMHKSDQKRFGDVLRRRFLREVRLSERKRRRLDGSLGQSCISDIDIGNEMEQLRASVDFLVELCETSSSLGAEEGCFRNWSHQAIEFILATLKALSLGGRIDDTVESIIRSLILRLMRRMCNGSQGDGSVLSIPSSAPDYMGKGYAKSLLSFESVHSDYDFQFYVQHLMRKLGSDPYVGQRVILSVSQRISMAAQSLLVMDPFDGAFQKMLNGMYLMIQLIELLISDYLLSWSSRQDLDTKLLEEWVVSVFGAREVLELLESRNTLCVLYMDGIVGALSRHLGQMIDVVILDFVEFHLFRTDET
ncbi:hypothetical protein PHJA_002534800 [Phtheirospermum japonicum]|uniref:Protein MULTIPOLAR SPINDLE 1 n=1 Tax=Phtheirospermum japonicum TaxID=374723 RepID=A0A830CXZ4_9LAMI|nr:hypothetical protein PHJA_002534800 [Phtheirospermum japonicum]